MTLQIVRTVQEQRAADRFARPTLDSIRAAQAQMLKERRELERDFHIQFDPFRDGCIKRDRRRK